ncbi:CAAX prenyl protease 2 [Tetranychus urticae]|uniref:CAAX prenyl protease 2 n=1 Tax=Tetranychus urticae TaxID=32264 RepID=T1KVA1_TETUR|nr:CAAX prenyl protease 2 [Tetranychus urticae]
MVPVNKYVLPCLICSVIAVIYMGSIRISTPNHDATRESVYLQAIGIGTAIIFSLSILLMTGHVTPKVLIPSFYLDLIPIGLIIILFSGPIIDRYMAGDLWDVQASDSSPFYTFLRINVFGPAGEEYVYRFLMTLVLTPCGDEHLTVFISSVLFSLSHFPGDFIKLVLGGAKLPWITIVFHLLQTFLFGCYNCAIYLRCQCLASVIVVHSICNWMGLPQIDRIFTNAYLAIITVLGLSLFTILSFTYLTSSNEQRRPTRLSQVPLEDNQSDDL